MGKVSTYTPTFIGIRCSNSDYGAQSNENSVFSLSPVFPQRSNHRASYAKFSYPHVVQHHKTAALINTVRGQYYVY